MSRLYCLSCGKEYSLENIIWRCACGGLLDIDTGVRFDTNMIATRKPGLWRYREAIPIADDRNIVSFNEGLTPLLEIEIESRHVLVKQDHIFPTGSYKDRGASVLISKVRELGIDHVVEDSSGNAGAAIAAYCARAGIICDIYVPSSIPAGKLKQIAAYKAVIHKIEGGREKAAKAALEAAGQYYYASHCWNPYFIQGVKTFAFEICEQLRWRSPDTLVLPAGNGTLVLGAYIGFDQLKKADIIDSIPKILAVQAENCAPLYQGFHNKSSEIPYIKTRPTIAEGIAIAEPVRGKQIIETVRATGGEFLKVSEDEITIALKEMHSKGYYIEPTSASTIAGLKQYLKKSRGDRIIVSTFTGHGLKYSGK